MTKPLDPHHVLVALTEARQQVVHRLRQAREGDGPGGWGTLRSAVIAQAALEVVKDFPEAVQLVITQAEAILGPITHGPAKNFGQTEPKPIVDKMMHSSESD